MKFPFIGMLVWDNRCQAVGTGQGKCHSHSYREILKEGKVGNELSASIFNPEVGKKQKPFGKVLFQFRENWF